MPDTQALHLTGQGHTLSLARTARQVCVTPVMSHLTHVIPVVLHLPHVSPVLSHLPPVIPVLSHLPLVTPTACDTCCVTPSIGDNCVLTPACFTVSTTHREPNTSSSHWIPGGTPFFLVREAGCLIVNLTTKYSNHQVGQTT